MSHKDEDQHRRNWIEHGEMNGDNAGVMNALRNTLPNTDSVSAADMHKLEQARNYMAELWLRGVSKKQFIHEMKLPHRRKKV